MLKKAFITIAVLALALASCSMPGPSTGIVQGVVYADMDSSGSIEEPAEGPLDGVLVTLADCGPVQTQTTGADGAFNFSGLPAGTCHVSVDKAGWIFSGSFPLISYPMPAASDPDLPTAFSMFMAPVMDFIPTDTPSPTPVVTELSTIVGVTETPTPPPGGGAAMVTPSGSEPVNCRFGPGTGWVSVGGGLAVGTTVPITGKSADGMWWQIQNPSTPGTYCFVAVSVTSATGDLSAVPVVPAPLAFVTSVSVTTPATVHGYCGGPNATSFMVSITTNGPTTVMYHVSIYNGDGTLRNQTSDEARTFASASTQTFDPGGAYKTDCGEFYIVAVITSPNAMTSAQAHWTVVEP